MDKKYPSQHVWEVCGSPGLLASPVPPEETDDHLVIRPLPQSLSREVKQPSTNIFSLCLSRSMLQQREAISPTLTGTHDGWSQSRPAHIF